MRKGLGLDCRSQLRREGGCDGGDLIKEKEEWASTKPVCLNP